MSKKTNVTPNIPLVASCKTNRNRVKQEPGRRHNNNNYHHEESICNPFSLNALLDECIRSTATSQFVWGYVFGKELYNDGLER